jgi:Skp family chaperone for outer membrane proteins
MKIVYIDLEKVLNNYKPHLESKNEVEEQKKVFSDRIDEIKMEMENIIKFSQSLLLDENTKNQNMNRFRQLQQEAIELETKFRVDIVQLQNEKFDENLENIKKILKDFSEKENIDYILDKNSAFYVRPDFDVTEKVISLF